MSENRFDSKSWPSVNSLSAPLVAGLLADSSILGLHVERHAGGAIVVDAGIHARGGLEAGRRIAEICMGGLGRVTLHASPAFVHWPWQLSVHSSNPVLSCLGSQYAGWSLACDGFFSLASGPARALAVREDLFAELAYRDQSDSAVLVLESDKAPPQQIIEKVSRDTGLGPERLTFILTPNRSLAGVVQIVGRVLEVALHKAHALRFPLDRILDGMGSAPLPPPSPDFITGMGRTNDAILYGGHVHLFVRGDDDSAGQLAKALPSSASRDYGKPFSEVFKAAACDFYKIDPMLFSPAAVTVTAIESGRSFHAGDLDPAVIDRSFGYSG